MSVIICVLLTVNVFF